jgi:hypothetical protein
MRLPHKMHELHALLLGTVFTVLITAVFVFGVTHAVRHAYFELTPKSFPVCQGPNIVAHVRWDATSSTREPVRIFVHKVGNAPKLWFSGSPAGEADTGKWIGDGSTLELTDHKGRLLARRTMETTPCAPG